MRTWFWAFALLTPLILAMPTQETRAQAVPAAHRKLALLVGISTYERGKQQPPDWWNLDCEPDVKQMKQVLTARFGFPEKNVTTLTTRAQTTRESILDAFHTLIATAQPGDIVWFHYSGHGQQVPELQEGQQLNGLDSSLIPSNYIDQHAGTVDPATNKPVGNINIRGTEMAALLNELKAKTGPTGSITLSIDCCFAGSTTRGGEQKGRLKERGRGWNVDLDGPRPGARKTTRGNVPVDGPGFFSSAESAQGGYVLLAATSINETAKEKDDDNQQPMGAFTYYLVKELSRVKPDSQMTYRELYERLQSDIVDSVKDQSPQAEGDLDRPLLGGARVVPDAAYIQVSAPDAATHSLTLGVGELEGVSVGSKYALYPAGTTNFKDASKRLAEATVTATDLNTAEATLDTKYRSTVKMDALTNARAIETAHFYGDNALKVALKGLGTAPVASQMTAQFAKSSVASLTPEAGHWDVLIRPAEVKERGGAGPTLVAERQDGTTVAVVPQDADAARNLGAALSSEWKWQYVNKMENTDAESGIKLQMRLVPITVVGGVPGRKPGIWKGNYTVQPKPLPKDGTRLTLREGDNYIIQVRNTGYKDAYVTVLDLANDGTVSCWYPNKSDRVREPVKGEGDQATWHTLPARYMLRSQAPFGTEVFKAIGTDTPADFSSLVDDAQNGTQRGGEDNPTSHTPLGRLLLDRLKGQRGGAAIEPSDWGTASATLENKPAGGETGAPERGIPAMSK